jgi:hypothetical protein
MPATAGQALAPAMMTDSDPGTMVAGEISGSQRDAGM